MTVRVTSEPPYEPITAAEFREWARIDSDDAQAAVAALLIQAMREYAENLTGRAFIQRGLQLIVPGWDQVLVNGLLVTGIELPCPPLAAVSSITYIDTDGVEQTLDASLYTIHAWHEPGVIVPAWGESLPATRCVPDAWRVNYVAGYPQDGSPYDETSAQAGMPAKLKLWVQARAATLYEHREQLIHNSRIKIPTDFADGLLDSLVIGSRLF